MDTTLVYENHRGERVEFKPASPFHYTGATVHDYAHKYATSGGRITRFYHELREYKLDALVAGSGAGLRDRLTDVFEADVSDRKPGRLWSGDYYLSCYVTASEKASWHYEGGYMRAKLTLVSEEPVWVREDYQICGAGTVGGTGIDYAHDWGFDYVSNVMIQSVMNDGVAPAPFVMQAYGPMAHPFSVTIGGTTYAVDVQLVQGQILRIDSRSKTIVLVDKDGSETNMFGKRVGEQRRGSGQYIFEEIPVGNTLVSWPADFTFDVTVYGNRPEPRWEQ